MAFAATKSIDIVGLADVFALMDVEENDFDNPSRFAKLEGISGYFTGKPDAYRDVLKVLAKDRRSDKVDAVWMWVQLAKQREAALQKLNPDDFTDDVAEELRNGFLTKEKQKQLKEQVLAEKERAKRESAERRQADREEQAYQRKADRATQKAFDEGFLEKTDTVLEELAAIQQQIDVYHG